MKSAFQPERILMLKGHSAGIGDLLRGSAAWRVLKNTYPGAELHLCFFTREPGYPSEDFIRQHHLLSGFTSIDKRTRTWSDWRRFFSEVRKLGREVRPHLVIDFEPNGLRNSLVAAWMAARWGARTVGITTAPGRNLFYSRAAPSTKAYATRRGLAVPMEYTERDFVALAALGLERNGTAIEMRENAAGTKFRQGLRHDHGLSASAPLLGLNIGCGTPGAAIKRPDFQLLSELVGTLQRKRGMRLVLTGAPFERAINQEFLALHQKKYPDPVIDLAGNTHMSELTGALNACALVISSDSGPYHIAVGLRVPTLCIFNWAQPESFHAHPWVRCCVASKVEHLPIVLQAAEELLAWHRVPLVAE